MNVLKCLELNDGWSQIPPKEDGVYWFQHAKPWHSENAYDLDLLMLVRIKDGKRVEIMGDDGIWIEPECESPENPVWDSESQCEMLAVWRLKRDGEDFKNLPPPIAGTIFERHPVKCPSCEQMGAVYRADGENPWICYSCGKTGYVDKRYFDMRFMEALKSAIKNDMEVAQET
jgi:ribosomal protein L37AE/L43A